MIWPPQRPERSAAQEARDDAETAAREWTTDDQWLALIEIVDDETPVRIAWPTRKGDDLVVMRAGVETVVAPDGRRRGA
jgi:hypothetical protein